MELLSSGFEARVFCLVGQIVSPAALQLDVVVDLLDHLLELAGVNAVGAHGGSSRCASQATLWPRWPVVVGAGAKKW